MKPDNHFIQEASKTAVKNFQRIKRNVPDYNEAMATEIHDFLHDNYAEEKDGWWKNIDAYGREIRGRDRAIETITEYLEHRYGYN